ncbi:hypothetical protein ACEQUB_p01500 (plasmid) [Ralstonia syzygii]
MRTPPSTADSKIDRVNPHACADGEDLQPASPAFTYGSGRKPLAQRLADRYADHVRLQAGKMVVELKPRGASKGEVVGHLMTTGPFAGRIALFAGDDLTDESAFEAVNTLGGWTIKVGTGPSQAHWRVPDPAALRDWLSTLARHAGGPAA